MPYHYCVIWHMHLATPGNNRGAHPLNLSRNACFSIERVMIKLKRVVRYVGKFIQKFLQKSYFNIFFAVSMRFSTVL